MSEEICNTTNLAQGTAYQAGVQCEKFIKLKIEGHLPRELAVGSRCKSGMATFLKMLILQRQGFCAYSAIAVSNDLPRLPGNSASTQHDCRHSLDLNVNSSNVPWESRPWESDKTFGEVIVVMTEKQRECMASYCCSAAANDSSLLKQDGVIGVETRPANFIWSVGLTLLGAITLMSFNM